MIFKRFLFLFALCAFYPFPSHAQLTLIRDTEIERMMEGWFYPVLQAANIGQNSVDVILVQDNQVNAFVAGGANIFFFTGLLEKTENPGEVIGVFAHELGHIEGGHLIRGREALEQASYESILGTILGVGAAIATGESGAAVAGSSGASSLAQRKFLATSRSFEASADQAALRSMEEAGVNPSGLVSFLEKLLEEELLTTSQQSEYVRTHPLTRNRVDALSARIEQSPHKDKPFPAQWMEEHRRMKAKLLGFINPPQVGWTYNDRDQSIAARYARTIAAYRQNRVQEALDKVDGLIEAEPQNPYFHELKGQMLVDFGRVEEALAPYQTAVSIMPKAGLIQTAYAHALIESSGSDRARLNQAIKHLEIARVEEPRSHRVFRLLGTAHARLGNQAIGKLYLAEQLLLQRRYRDARFQAEGALEGLNPGTQEYLRAQDILKFIEQNTKLKDAPGR